MPDMKITPYLAEEQIATTVQAVPYLVVDYDKFSADVKFSLDVNRGIYRTDTCKLDVARKIIVNVHVTQKIDVLRVISQPDSCKLDIFRHLLAEAEFNLDVVRNTGRDIENTLDIRRVIPQEIITMDGGEKVVPNVQNIEINLKSATLSDTFTLSTPLALSIGDRIEGKILDFPYRYDVESTSQQDIILTAQGMTDSDAILYSIYDIGKPSKPVTSSRGKKKQVTPSYGGIETLTALAKATGKTLHAYFDGFLYIGDLSNQTYQSLLSSVFGWSSQAPTLLINVYIRKDELYAVQRGHEPNEIDLTDSKHTRPTIAREIVRTVWQPSDDVTKMHNPFWAWQVLDWFDDDELYKTETVKETAPQDEGHTVTKTIEQGNVSEVIDVAEDGTETRTFYQYAGTGRDSGAKLEKQTETTTDAHGNQSTAQTYYDYNVHYGYVEGRKYRDGEYTGSAVAQGEAGTPSRYARKKEAGRKNRIPKTLEWVDLNAGKNEGDGTSRNLDYKTYIHLQCEIKRLNRKIKETVSFDVYNLDHVIDFTDRIKFNGNTYFLESNRISEKPTEFKQSIELVRWYGAGTKVSDEEEASMKAYIEKIMKANNYEYMDGVWIYNG